MVSTPAERSAPSSAALQERVFALERPHPSLFRYYLLVSLVAGPFFPVVLAPLYFRYHTLRYRFDNEGVSMRWGVLFRREINLTYARIQDIHLSSNVVERWLGLARVEIQTASGSAKAEMTVEGVREFDEVRDFLYSRMRGTRDREEAWSEAVRRSAPRAGQSTAAGSPETAADAELAALLRQVTGELRALREELAARSRQTEPRG